jgi:hypothetical protein
MCPCVCVGGGLSLCTVFEVFAFRFIFMIESDAWIKKTPRKCHLKFFFVTEIPLVAEAG